MKPFIILGAALMLVAGLGGCKSQKQALPSPSQPSASVSAQIPEFSPDSAFATLTASYGQWEDVALNLRLNLTQPSKFGASAKVTMRRGQWIALSVRLLGFEVAAARIDADSVRGFVKTSKLYVAEGVSSLLGSGKVTITDLQDLLLGRVFLAGQGTLTEDMRTRFLQGQQPEFWTLEPKQQPKECQYGFAIDYSDCRLLATYLNADRASAAASYADYAATPFGTFASEILLNVAALPSPMAEPLNVEASLRWDLDGAKWNTGADPAFKIPSSCRRVSTDRLLKALSSL